MNVEAEQQARGERGERSKRRGSICCDAHSRLTFHASLIGKYATQMIHFFQCHARAAYHASQWVVGDDDGQAGFFHQQAIEIAQQRTTTGQHHTAFGNVSA